ncbi:glycosyltransferase [Lutibacter sp. A80]|uniref:glycosyltransferase n=1 Tax=Lutibacter sp. A80 TaxID=2918453 RepID=UPI001F06AA9C|nr:glycosyltransferase [Lutibacter sp. A80]UMB60346.1 glycosyltransferase [Lutibacter sp. A80]
MKVLQVINSLHTGGAEKLLLESIPLYVKQGIKMDILLLNGSETPFLTALKKQECCRIFSIGKGWVYNPFLILKIILYLKHYDVVHVHLFPALYFVALAKIMSFSKVKFVYTEHNTNNKRRRFYVFKLIDRIIYENYKKIITISNDVELSLKKHLKTRKSKFIRIQNGVNFQKFSKVNAYKCSDFFSIEDKILIQVSSFTHQKDQVTLIKSLTALPEQVKLLLVGEGELKERSEVLVQKLKLTTRVKFLGIRMDVPQLLKTADICILSSKWEGFGLVAVEGMSCGKPLIATNVPGLNQIVKGAGLLFPVGDEKVLAKHIMDLLHTKNYYNKVANACLERSKKYDIELMVNKHIALYNSLI